MAMSVLALTSSSCPLRASSLSSGWSFTRGDPARAAEPDFDSTGWRVVDIPHDWSAEDLPPRDADDSTPVLAVRAGSWRFAQLLGNASFAAPTFGIHAGALTLD